MHPTVLPDPRDRRGVALLTTMLLVLLLLVAVTAAFTRSSSEFRTATDQTAVVDAFALAQSGLDSYVAAQIGIPGSLPDSQAFTFPGGRAVVTLHAARLDSSDSTFVLVSRGENTSTNRYNSSASTATRTVAQLLRYSTGSFEAPSALTVLGGFHQNGSSATYSGLDACGQVPAIPGIALPTDSFSFTGNGGGKKGGGTSDTYTGIDGSPDDMPYEMGEMDEAADAIEIDWAGIVDGSSLPASAHVVTAGGNQAPAGWQSSWFPSSPKANPWPIVKIDGASQKLNSTLSGYGILILTGDAEISGNWDWDGIVLIGGAITGNGNNNVRGALLVGLNHKLGIIPNQSDLSNGTKLVEYNSCYIASAMGTFAGWQRLGNAWVDSWPSY